MGLDDGVVEQAPLTVQADHFAPGAEAGVHGQDAARPQGRGQKKLAQIFAEHPDGLGVGPLFKFAAQFVFQRGKQQAATAVVQGRARLLDGRGAAGAGVER